MFNLTDSELENYIKEDLPYFDFTTHMQNAKNIKVTAEIFTREDILVSCSEEASRITEILGCKVKKNASSGTKIKKDETILKIKGSYEDIQKSMKLAQMLLEYSCKMSTYTNNMINEINDVNKNCELLTTRKTIPFAKRLCIKSILCAGALPHRLGLSESILLFDYHRTIYKNDEKFYEEINKIKNRLPEKKVVVESKTYEDSIKLLEKKVDVLQLDKMDLDTTKKIIEQKNKINKNTKILVAGGINLSNVKEYAKLQVDGIVSSSMYSCGLANLSCKVKIKE
ncbi:ModD protein [Arcobacter sp. CECT 8986]|uniref:ModD protein n=1 Tax=Arcobacter sp. CECT 8986 TaxID=2044507 RepID=UPI001009F427|nr:ModD protein [Arcobacter sp. CECT 8986]RXK00529.1 ModD protein [Arcobacter sp. CECT 8986]